VTQVHDMDPFSRRQLIGQGNALPGIAGRYMALQEQHKKAADAMFVGMLAAEFTDHELAILNDSPYMCDWWRILMKKAGRQMERP
jgi:hypothetical protein